MTDFIKKNKFLTHVIVECSCLCLMFLYVNRTSNNLGKQIQFLEQKIYQYENILEKHDQILNSILNRKLNSPVRMAKEVRFKKVSPEPVRPKFQRPPSGPPLNSPQLEEEDREEDREEDLDDEINQELDKLNLLKQNQLDE